MNYTEDGDATQVGVTKCRQLAVSTEEMYQGAMMIESVRGDIEVKGLQLRNHKQLNSLRHLFEEAIKNVYTYEGGDGDIDVQIRWYELLGIGDDSNQEWVSVPQSEGTPMATSAFVIEE